MAERAETQYLNLLKDIRDNGEQRTDRTGVGTRSLFGEQMKYDLREGAPVLTSKRVALGSVAHELVWMLDGDSNIEYLVKNKVPIWNEWPFVSWLDRTGQTRPPQGSDEWNGLMKQFTDSIANDHDFAAAYGDLGPVYGYQWRHWSDGRGGEVDQILQAQETIRKNPDSRRIIVNAWNVADIEEMAKAGLPPCHMTFQFYGSQQKDPETGKPYLDMKMYQRSADMFLGVPFNMAQYAMLLMMMAQATDREARYFVHTFGDTHIYNNHVDQVNEQLSRADNLYPIPRIVLNPDIKDITAFRRDDIGIEGYESHPAIKAPIAV